MELHLDGRWIQSKEYVGTRFCWNVTFAKPSWGTNPYLTWLLPLSEVRSHLYLACPLTSASKNLEGAVGAEQSSPCPGFSPALHVSVFPRLSAWLVSGLRWSLISFQKPSLIFKAEQITSFIYCLFNPLWASMREKIMFLFLQLKFLIHCVALGRWLINICWI